MTVFLDLIRGFLKVGCFAFGGAYGAISLIRNVALSHGWLTDEALSYIFAVSESTPGPIMVNLATFVGSSKAGFWGALVATIAVVTPAFIIMLLFAEALNHLVGHPHVDALLDGLKSTVIGIIGATGVYLTAHNVIGHHDGAWTLDIRAAVITAATVALIVGWTKIRKKKPSTITVILISAVMGMIVYGV